MSVSYQQETDDGDENRGCKFGNSSPVSEPENQGFDAVPKIDTEWFRQILKDREMSESFLAEKMGRDKSTINRLLHGQRKWTAPIATAMAVVLAVDPEELFRRIGSPLPRESHAKVPLQGVVGVNGLFAAKKKGVADRPGVGLPPGVAAVRVQAAGSIVDGWTAYYTPGNRVEPEAIGRLSIVGLENKGARYLGILKRGYSAGAWNVWKIEGDIIVEDVAVATATPILWVRC